jgi:hypothetical protein
MCCAQSLDLALLKTALVKARVHGLTDKGRESLANSVNVLAFNTLSKRAENDLVIQSKHLGEDQASAGVLVVEGSQDAHGLASWVHLDVEGTRGEDGHLSGAEVSANDPGLAVLGDDAALGDHLGDDGAVECDKELGSTGVDMQRAKATGTNASQGEGSILADKRRERLAVGEEGRGVVKVVDKVLILQQAVSIDGVVGKGELGRQAELGAVALALGRRRSGHRGHGQDGSGDVDNLGNHFVGIER